MSGSLFHIDGGGVVGNQQHKSGEQEGEFGRKGSFLWFGGKVVGYGEVDLVHHACSSVV